METPLHFKSAVEIAALIKARKVSALEALEHFLARVAKHNPRLNAIIWMDADRARARARAADAALAKGESWGPLHGVPMTIKESYQVAGSPTTWGDPAMKGNVTEESALAVSRLEKAGVVLFGKTNVPLMLADWQSYNEIYGTTNNPWNTAMIPGGSSGGSAAALAAGLTGVEAGSDIGSSIRNPAHYCGVFGLKPTYGVVAMRRHSLPGAFAPADISAIGPLTRGAGDLDVMLDAMAGPDELDDQCWRLDLPKATATSLKGMRIAVKLRDPNCEIDGEYADRLQALVDDLARKGAKVKEIEPAIDTRRLHEIYVLLLEGGARQGWRGEGALPRADGEGRHHEPSRLDRPQQRASQAALRLQRLLQGLGHHALPCRRLGSLAARPGRRALAAPHHGQREARADDRPALLGGLLGRPLPPVDRRPDRAHRTVQAPRRLSGHRPPWPRQDGDCLLARRRARDRRDTDRRCRDHLPLNTGRRFSMNARRPSM